MDHSNCGLGKGQFNRSQSITLTGRHPGANPSRKQLAGSKKLMASLSRTGRFVLLSEPAGFGETTLLSEFVPGLQQPVVWLSLDEVDNDPARFWSYLIAARQMGWPGVGEAAPVILQSSQPLPTETLPTFLIKNLASLDRELVLILDDYSAIQNETAQ
jgi:LuxR family transcriptional regulator, maltose regulon positive regulatory protein